MQGDLGSSSALLRLFMEGLCLDRCVVRDKMAGSCSEREKVKKKRKGHCLIFNNLTSFLYLVKLVRFCLIASRGCRKGECLVQRTIQCAISRHFDLSLLSFNL